MLRYSSTTGKIQQEDSLSDMSIRDKFNLFLALLNDFGFREELNKDAEILKKFDEIWNELIWNELTSKYF